MDTASNIKFNVEGDDKFSQFLEKTQKSFKELNEKSIKLFNAGLKESNRGLKEITKNFQTKSSVVDTLIKDYGKATAATNNWATSMGKLAKVTGLVGVAMNALNVYSIGSGILKTVGTGVSEILNAVTMTNTGINVMAASGFDGTPLMNSFDEIAAVLTGNQQAIEMFASRSIAAFNTFEQKLNEVNIIFGLSKDRLSEYGDALQNGLEKNLKNSLSSLTGLNAAYQAASAGFTDFQQNLEVVQLAVKANKAAPGSDLFQIGGAIGKGAGILETKDIKELELTTAKWLATEQQGLTTVGEMTEYLTGMYSALKNAGVGTDDLVDQTQGLVVAFTKLGAKVPEITTQMEAFSRNVISKTPEAQKALEGLVDAQGKAITLNQQYFKEKGIVQGITDFAEAVGYNTEKIKAVYNETNAFAFAMKVLAQNGKLAKDSIESISKVTSEDLNSAFDSATSSSQAKMEQITNSYDEIMISFGKAFQKRSDEGVKSIEWYQKALVQFKDPLITIAKTMVTFFDNVNKVTGTIGALSKMLISITGTILSFRAFGLVLGGLTNGFKDLRKEGSVIKELYQSNQGLLAIGKQVLGLDQQKLLSQKRINDAIKNSTELETGLTNAIGKTSAERLTSISAVKNEIDAIVARDESIVKGQQKVDKVQESLTKKTDSRNSQQSEVSGTQKTLANLKTLRQDINNSLRDDEENIKRSNRLKDISAQESLIKQGNIGKEERRQLKELNTEKLRLQDTYNKTTIDQLNSLQKQKEILNNKSKKSDRDREALSTINAREKQLIDREKNKDRTPLDDTQKGKLTNARDNLSSKITQEELVLLTQRQKLQEANNAVTKEAEKLEAAKTNQTEKLNRVTKSTTDLAVLQQDLNTKKNNLDRVNIATTGQQERLYTIQNALRKEQNTLDKIRNKDSQEYQQQLAKVTQLQSQEAAQIGAVQKAKTVQKEARQVADQADLEARKKLLSLTNAQGLAEGSLIELQTKSGPVVLKNTMFNRALISATEGYGKAVTALKTPVKSFTELQESLKNKLIDFRTNLSQVDADGRRTFNNLGSTGSLNFKKIADSAQFFGEALKGAFVSTGIGLVITAVIALGTRLFQIGQESKKLDKTYKDFNTTLDEAATKFDRANVSFDKGSQGLSKFNDRVENSKKILSKSEPNIFNSIGSAIGNAFKLANDFHNSIKDLFSRVIPGFKELNAVSKVLGDTLFFLGDKALSIFTGWSETDFAKKTEKMSQVSGFIQKYENAIVGQNKALADGNLLTETSNQKIKARMILTGEDLEREKAANNTRIESFQSMTDVQKKELDELKSKGDSLRDSEKKQIKVLETEISRREKIIEVSKKQFEDQLKYYEARNLLLDRQNKFSNEQVSLQQIQTLQSQVDKAQTTLNNNITEGLDVYSSSIKNSQAKSEQFLSDLRDGSLSVKATLKSLGGEIYKVGEDGKVLSNLPDTVLKSIETVLKGQEIDGKKYSLEQVLNLKETKEALKEAGISIPKNVSVLADKIKKSYKTSEDEVKLLDIKSLEKDLADFSVLSDKYKDKRRSFLSTTKEDVGATAFSTSLNKSLRLAETDLQNFNNALDASSKGLNKYTTASTEKFTKDALEGTLDLTEGLKELGIVESDLTFNQLLKLKLSITGKNKDQILNSLKEIGVETEKVLTADSIDFNKFEENIGAFVESLNAVAEAGEATSEETAKKFEIFYNQMQGKVTPAAYKTLTETLISYEKAASEQKISNLTLETNALEQQKRYGLVLETDYIKEINALNIQTTEENIKNKQIELKRLLSLYKDSAPQVIKAKAELEALELDLKAKKSSNPVEIAQAESKTKFDILKRDLELGNITKRKYIEEELNDSKNLYNVQLEAKRETLNELLKDERKNAKAIKALRKSMELDEKEFNLRVLEINRQRIEEQFKLQFNAQSKKELDVRKAAIDGSTKKEIEKARKVETERITLNIKSLEARLALEKKGSDKFLEIEKQLVEAQLSLRETQVKQAKDKINEEIELKKNKLNTLLALEERNNLAGTTEKSLENTRKLKEQEIQLSIDQINSQIALTEKGSKERLALETQLVLEVNRLQKTQLDNQKERLEVVLEESRRKLESAQIALESTTISGTTDQDVENSRKLKEEEIKNTLNELNEKSKLYNVGSKERVQLEREIAKETLRLNKQVYENLRSTLQAELDNRKRLFKENQLQLENLILTGTTTEDAKNIRKSKEEELEINIEATKKDIAITKEGSTQRRDLEIKLKEELLQLDRQRLTNRRELIEEEITLEKTKISKIQALLDGENANGVMESNLEKLRLLKEQETKINIDSINKQLATYKLGAKERLVLETQLIQETSNLQKLQFNNNKERLENQLNRIREQLENKQLALEKTTITGTTLQDIEANRKIKEEDIKNTIYSLKQKANLYKEGSKERIELEREIVRETLKLDKQLFDNQKSRLVEQLDNRKRLFKENYQQLEKLLVLGTSVDDAKKLRDSKEEDIQINIQGIREEIEVAKEGSTQRRDLEISLRDELLKLDRQRVANKRELIEEEASLEKTKISNIQSLLDRNTVRGTLEADLDKLRELKEKETQITIDSLKKQLATYKLTAKERLTIESQLISEVTKLQKTQFENQKERLEASLDKTQKALEKRQIALEKLTIAGTTNEDLEASRQMRETEISNAISSLKQRSTLYKEGSKERITLEQEIAKETLKLDKQVYENQKSRLEQQINEKRRAFKSSQLDLEKLLVLGTSTEDAKKVRTAKEEEINLNIDAIRKQVAMAKVGSTQRKDLEVSLKDELVKLDRQKIANKRELIDEEIQLEKTKISKIQSLLERSTIEGTFEKDLDKIRALKEKETQITIDSIKKQLATYKLGAKERLSLEAQLTQEITNLQKLQFNNKKDRLEAQLEEAKTKLDKQIALKESTLVDGGTEEELKAMESMKVKEIQLNVDSIRKQIKLYKEGSKERLALEVSLQKELNNLRRASLDKEKNLIQLALDFKKTKIDIANIESEKLLLKGDISREQFEDKAALSSQKINLLQQEALSRQLKLYQKGSKEYLEILKQISQLQVDYQKSVVEDAIRQIDRLTKKQNNSIESQKQNIQKQLNSSDYLTKQLQEQIKLEDSRNSLVKASSDYQIGLLELSKRTTGDAEKRAKIDLKIAETKQKSLLESQVLEINSIKNNEAINRAALEREKIQLSLNKLELDRSRISTEAELRKAKLNKLDQASIDALQLQLQAISGQYGELQRSEDIINTQISNQAVISQNQLSVIKQQQDLAQKNGNLEVEQARQNIVIAGYEKQLTQLRMKGSLIEANANKEKTIGDLLTKSYDAQISTLNARKEVMDSTLASIDSLYGIEQSMAKSDLTKEKLAQDQAKDRLTFLELQQRMERDSFNLEKAKNKIVRERQKVELEIAEINARQALATSKAEEARTNARKDATDEEKLAAKLAVESAEQGIIAAKVNKEISLELGKIEEQSEKNKEIINTRNQRNQKLQAQMAFAQTTTNTLDDREVAGQARKFREQDERSLRDITSVSTEKIDSIVSDFQKAMEARKPIELEDKLKDVTSSSPDNKIERGGYASSSKVAVNNINPKNTEAISQTNKGIEDLKKVLDDNLKTVNTSIGNTGNSITKTILDSSNALGKLLDASLKNLGKNIISSIRGDKPKNKKNTAPIVDPITKEPIIDSLKTVRQSIDAFKLDYNTSNQAKKNEDDLRHKDNLNKSDRLYKGVQELIDVMENYIANGGNVIINSPINVTGGDKNTGLDINKHLYNLATKVERRQK